MWVRVVNQEYMRNARYHGEPTLFPNNDAEALEMGWTGLEWDWFRKRGYFEKHKFIEEYCVLQKEMGL